MSLHDVPAAAFVGTDALEDAVLGWQRKDFLPTFSTNYWHFLLRKGGEDRAFVNLRIDKKAAVGL